MRRLIMSSSPQSPSSSTLTDLTLNLRPVKGQFIRVRSQETRKCHSNPRCLFDPRLDNGVLAVPARRKSAFKMERPERLWICSPMLGEHSLFSTCRDYRNWFWVSTSPRPRKPLPGTDSDTQASLAIGHYRHGVLLAPAAKGLLDELLSLTRVDMRPFAPLRSKACVSLSMASLSTGKLNGSLPSFY